MGSLLQSTKIVAAAYGKKLGVNVIPSNTAYTDGKNIHTIIDEGNPDATWGFLCHESAHVRFTNFHAIKRMPRLLESSGLGCFNLRQFKSVVNALEDNRIEYSFMQDYKGSYRTFNAMNETLIKEGKWAFKYSNNPLDLVMQFVGYYSAGHSKGLSYKSCIDLTNKVESALMVSIKKEYFDLIQSLVLNSVKSKSTEEILGLSLDLLSVMKKINSDDSQSGNSQSGNSQSGNSQSGDSQSKGDNPIDICTTFLYADKGDQIGEVLHDSKTKSYADVRIADYKPHKPTFNDEPVNRYQEGIRNSSKLLVFMNNLLEARARTKKALSTKGRKINKRLLTSTRLGKKRVFQTKKEGIESSTAVHIAVDLSTSMNNRVNSSGSNRLDLALQALSALGHAIERTRKSVLSINGFTSGYTELKTFEQKMANLASVIDSLEPDGSTSFDAALTQGAISLSTVNHNRKVLMLITDGDAEPCKELADEIRSGGVELLCIGICLRKKTAENVASNFKQGEYVNISDIEMLNSELLKLAAKIL